MQVVILENTRSYLLCSIISLVPAPKVSFVPLLDAQYYSAIRKNPIY
uniref:Uncharacterized protein n=1 Tax=Anguilla anguilla TaxID=7936 RepID=A0A0E9RU13_ANGAN